MWFIPRISSLRSRRWTPKLPPAAVTVARMDSPPVLHVDLAARRIEGMGTRVLRLSLHGSSDLALGLVLPVAQATQRRYTRGSLFSHTDRPSRGAFGGSGPAESEEQNLRRKFHTGVVAADRVCDARAVVRSVRQGYRPQDHRARPSERSENSPGIKGKRAGSYPSKSLELTFVAELNRWHRSVHPRWDLLCG